MGVEKPFTGRKRISLEHLTRSEEIGRAGIDQVIIDEQRLALGFSYTINPRIAVSARIPWVEKQLENASLAKIDTSGLGDVSLSAKIFLQPQTGMVKEMYGLSLGLLIPTAEEKKSPSGELLDIDAQPGAGSTIPSVGGWYGQYKFPWFFYASSVVNLPSDGNQNFKPGVAIVTSFQAQYAPTHKLAFQLGLDTRWSEQDEFSGISDKNSGGFLAYITPGAVINLSGDLLLQLQAQLPAIDNLNGHHKEPATFSLGLIYDF